MKDVIAVNIKTGSQRVMARNLDDDEAEAFIRMAIYRRGVEEEFYKAIAATPNDAHAGDHS